MFGRHDAVVSEDEALEVALFAEQDDAEHDVDLGGHAPRGERSRLAVLGVIAAVVGLGSAAWFLGRDSPGDESSLAPDAEDVTSSSAVATTTGDGTTSSAVEPSTTTTLSSTEEAAPLLATSEPWRIWMIDMNTGRPFSIDVQTGAVDRPTGDGRVIVQSEEGTFTATPPQDSGFFGAVFTPSGPDPGTFWSVGYEPATGLQTIALYRAVGEGFSPDGGVATAVEIVAELDGSTLGGQFGLGLLGSTSDGEAVVQGPDGRALAVTADGDRRRLADGLVTSVQNGHYLEVRCDEQGACVSLLHGAQLLPIPYVAQQAATFSLDGTRAILSTFDPRDGSVSAELVDLATGERRTLEGRFEQAYFGYGPTAALVFTPDGSAIVGTFAGVLVTFDVATLERREVRLPSRSRASTAVIAVG